MGGGATALLPERGDFKGAATFAWRCRTPVPAARCNCGAWGGALWAVTRSAFVGGKFAEVHLELSRLSPCGG
jgi:hypothetical protein